MTFGTSDQIALAALILSTLFGVVSTALSIRANRISAAAERHARAVYEQERRIALISSIEPDTAGHPELRLGPNSDDQTINNVRIVFPRRFGLPEIGLTAGSLRFSLVQVAARLGTYWDELTPPLHDRAQVRRNAPIPVCLVVHGQNKGVAVICAGIYDLYCEYVRVEAKPGHVRITGLALNNWFDSGVDPELEVEKVFTAYDALSRAKHGT